MNDDLVDPDRTDVRRTHALRVFDRNGEQIDEWEFTCGVRYDSEEPIPFFVSGEGEKVDYNLAAFGANVVSDRLADLIEAVARRDV